MQVLSKAKGKTLVGTTYQPLFPYFAHLKAKAALPNGTAANGVHSGPSGAFRVISDAYVRDDSGTGVVHQAPAFGEDDFRICIENGQACCLCLLLLSADVVEPACINGEACSKKPLPVLWWAPGECCQACLPRECALVDSPRSAGIVGKGEDMPCPVDGEGRFTPEVADFSGRSA